MKERKKRNPKSDFCWRWSKELFKFMLETNRKAGVNGEVYFFYEGLSVFENEIKTSYKPTKN